MLKKLLSDTALYGLSSVLGRLLNYLLVPLHTVVLSLNHYGEVSQYYAYAAFFNVLYTFGMETAFFRFTAQYKPEQKAERQAVFNTAFSVILSIGLVGSGLLWLSASTIANYVGDASHIPFIRWFAGIFFIDAIVIIPFARLRIENKAKKFAAVRLTNILMSLVLNYAVLGLCHWAATGQGFLFLQDFAHLFYEPEAAMSYVFLINLVANAFVLPFLIPELKGYTFALNTNLYKKMLAYGYPIVLMGLFFCINEVGNRNFLEWWLPAGYYGQYSAIDAVGIFSGCYKLSIFITLAVQAFKYAAEPFFFGRAADKNSPQLFAVVMRYFVIACTLMFVGVSLNLDIFKHFLGKPDYWEGIGVVPILLLANIFLGIYYNLAVCFKLTDKTIYGAYMGFAGSLITLVGNYCLIPLLGYWGCAWSTLVCYGGMCVCCYVWGERHFPVPYFLKSALFVLLSASVLVWFCLQLPIQELYRRLAIGNGLGLLYALLVGFYEYKNFGRVQKTLLKE